MAFEAKSRGILKVAALMSFAGMLYLNYLANALPLGGKSTGELSALYPNLFVPAGITFSIWAFIYLLLVLFLIRLLSIKGSHFDEYKPLVLYFIFINALNALWIWVWHQQWVAASVLVMIGLLSFLIKANLKIQETHNLKKDLITRPAFSIYLGWILVATLANITTLFVDLNLSPPLGTQLILALILMFTALLIGIQVLRVYRNPFPILVIFWAIFGIFLRYRKISFDGLFKDFDPSLFPLALLILGIAFVLVFYIMPWFRKGLQA